MTFITKRSFSHRLDNGCSEIAKNVEICVACYFTPKLDKLTCAKKILSGDIFMQDRCLLYFAERVTGEVVSII